MSAGRRDADRWHVCFAADRHVAMPLAVALASLYVHHPADALEVHILQEHLDAPLLARVKRGLPAGARIQAHRIPPGALAGLRMPAHFVPASFYRLLLGSVLPGDLTRVVYLDADVLCRAPLDALWTVALDGCAVGAVRDATMPWVGSPHGTEAPQRWAAMGLPPEAPYFNSGVLVIDLPAWRTARIEERAFALAREHLLPYGDQDALVASCGRFQALHPRYNLLPEHFNSSRSHAWVSEGADRMAEALAAPALVHLTSSLRPWVYSYYERHPLEAEWFAALDRTDFRGFRPRPRLLASVRNALARILKT